MSPLRKLRPRVTISMQHVEHPYGDRPRAASPRAEVSVCSPRGAPCPPLPSTDRSRRRCGAAMRLIFAGRVALVTGASRGIGKAIALDLARNGATVVATATTATSVAETVAAIRDIGGMALAAGADLRHEEDAQALVATVIEQLGELDILVNSAGVAHEAFVNEETTLAFSEILSVNLAAPFIATREAIRHLARSRHGAVVNIGSVLGSVTMPGQAAYCSSKAGLHHLTRELAVELAPLRIHVNCVAPGYISTDMLEASHSHERKQRIACLHPLNRFGTVDEVAHLVTFLSSDSSSFITGACVPVDSGLTAQFGLGQSTSNYVSAATTDADA